MPDTRRVKMRFRTDGWHFADLKSHGWDRERFVKEMGYPPEYIDEFEKVPKAEPGDVWRVHWRKSDADGNGIDGPIAGYAICCIKCGHVHVWTTAGNCHKGETTHEYTDDKGVKHSYKICEHNGTGSCWTWTGSAEDNTLSAFASLQVTDQKCGFHGWLENGYLRFC